MSHRFVAEAPGRLDVMGGISDYSGGLVLQQVLRETTHVEFSPSTDGHCVLTSVVGEEIRHAEFGMDEVLNDGLVDYSHAARFFKGNEESSWAAYVIGVALVLMKEKALPFEGGAFQIRSTIPPGKGVSSSAALEMATLRALADAFRVSFVGTESAILAQMAENQVAGAACGLMDQLATGFGRAGALLPILCQPDILSDCVSVPEGLMFTGLDSGLRHAVGGSTYADVRCAAFMGYTLIALECGLSMRDLEHHRSSGARGALPFGGYLANIPPDEFRTRWERLLPETMTGREFLRAAPATIDVATVVAPDTTYAVRTCARHPILERHRTHSFLQQLNSAHPDPHMLGKLMFESHDAYTACGLGSPRTDEIVERVRAGYTAQIPGARISGGGSGGTVSLLAVGIDGAEAVEKLRAEMEHRFGSRLGLFVPELSRPIS